MEGETSLSKIVIRRKKETLSKERKRKGETRESGGSKLRSAFLQAGLCIKIVQYKRTNNHKKREWRNLKFGVPASQAIPLM
jgi:hypothetical protein